MQGTVIRFLLLSLSPIPSIGWAIRHVQSEASSTGQTEADQQVKLLPSASLLPVPPGQHPLMFFIPS